MSIAQQSKVELSRFQDAVQRLLSVKPVDLNAKNPPRKHAAKSKVKRSKSK